jgi:hypothetical protein
MFEPKLIEPREALSWLNELEDSQIPTEQKVRIDRIAKTISLGLRRAETNWLIGTVSIVPEDPKLNFDFDEKVLTARDAEALAHCCVLRYEEYKLAKATDPRCLDEVKRYITVSYCYYLSTNDEHRQAVTGYIRSIILRELEEYWEAALSAKNALLCFTKEIETVNQFAINPGKGQRKNYANINAAIIDHTEKIMVGRLVSPPDLYAWFSAFHDSRLSTSARAVQEHLRRLVENGSVRKGGNKALIEWDIQCFTDMTRFDKSDKDQRATGEAYAYCGMVLWLLDENQAALNKLEKALEFYSTADPEHALIGWMIGQIRAEIFIGNKLQGGDIAENIIGDIMCRMEKSVREVNGRRYSAYKKESSTRQLASASIPRLNAPPTAQAVSSFGQEVSTEQVRLINKSGKAEPINWYTCQYAAMRTCLQTLMDRVIKKFESEV